MRCYAVIDTNVIISAMLKANSTPWLVVKEALDGCITPILNNAIVEE